MSRPLLLVSLLLLMVFTSQFEWNQHLVNEAEARPLALSQKQQYVLEREESVKEKTHDVSQRHDHWTHTPMAYLIDKSIKMLNFNSFKRGVKKSCEEIILSQEKHIQKLKTLVQTLQEQLLACRGKDEFVNDTTGSFNELLNELNHQQIME